MENPEQEQGHNPDGISDEQQAYETSLIKNTDATHEATPDNVDVLGRNVDATHQSFASDPAPTPPSDEPTPPADEPAATEDDKPEPGAPLDPNKPAPTVDPEDPSVNHPDYFQNPNYVKPEKIESES